jgi:LmbE family N-acetylglucosaminyl deacetylase
MGSLQGDMTIMARVRQKLIGLFIAASSAALIGLTAHADAPPPLFPEPMSGGEIRLALKKMTVLGRVLYIAAHPDDENTNLMAFWANGSLFQAAYLSVTRGDGGQNLIGSELRERLGVIRTEELLAARRLDHAQQFFTRAVDFGFSKTAEETLRIWDREKVLSDIVWVIRRFRPDVIVTRFSPDDTLTHGHHTASAILAREAFTAAADPKRFPEQLSATKPWQATRLVWNTSPFFYSNRNLPFDPVGLTTLEAGGFNALLGKAYTEIAAASLSMHKSQGVGSPPRRGARTEYFKLLDGQPMTTSLFEGVRTNWSRVAKAEAIGEKVNHVLAQFRDDDPAGSVPELLELRKALRAIADDDWGPQKRAELDRVIADCLGLNIEASTAQAAVSPGGDLAIKLEAINRSKVPVTLRQLRFPVAGSTMPLDSPLPSDQLVSKDVSAKLPNETLYSQPYWLRQAGTIGTFRVDDQALIGLPENPPIFPAEVTLEIGGQEFVFLVDTRHRTVDPVAGELRQEIVISPPVFANLSNGVLLFPNKQAKTIQVRVTAATGAVKGKVRLVAPDGWQVDPASVAIDLKNAEAEAVATFSVKPLAQPGEGKLTAVVSTETGEYSFARVRISYPHIGLHVLMPPAESKLVRTDIQRKGQLLGYIPGAGDDVPESLDQIGYNVKMLGEGEITAKNLAQFTAVVLGIRAYNTQERIASWLPELIAYARNGGVVIAQYNTTADLKTKEIGPYPLEISRDRVTDENAAVRILAPDHPVLNTPNKITAQDFEGWVQERGLYFPNKWDPAWTPILSCHDPNEKPLDGGLLVAKTDQGYFVYTGYSWFRQLPAGVPGAYRLFANMVSLGK